VGGTGNTSSLAKTCFASLLLSHHPEDAFSIESHSLLDSLASQTHEDLKDYSFTEILTLTNNNHIEDDSLLGYSKVEAVHTSETVVYFNEITQCYIPEGCLFILTTMRTRNLTFIIFLLISANI
jgi:hypothetical protein